MQDVPGKSPSFETLAQAAPFFEAARDDDPALALGLETSSVHQPPLIHRRFSWYGQFPLPSVRNQGSWNACTSFAAVAMIEARRRRVLNSSTRLVPGHIHNCSLGITSSTASAPVGDVLQACVSRGVAVGDNDGLPVAPSLCASPHVVRLSSWGWETGLNNILNRLVSYGPMLATMNVDQSFFNMRGPGVYDASQAPGAQLVLHAVLLIGYDVDAGWAEFLNSAGSDWGVNGIGRARIGGAGQFLEPRSAAYGLE